MEQPITISYLTTKPDYVDFKTAAAKAVSGKYETYILRFTGCGLVFAALLLKAFFSRNFAENVICTIMAIVGVIVGAFYESIVRYFIRSRAYREFEVNKNKFIAQTAEFDEKKITLKTDRYAAALPYELFYRAYEDEKVFILYTGIDEMRFIPKRAISEQECKQIQNILRTKLNEKYQQEGAR
jgi:predicted histidine transporter YuiF (NhaC family)